MKQISLMCMLDMLPETKGVKRNMYNLQQAIAKQYIKKVLKRRLFLSFHIVEINRCF